MLRNERNFVKDLHAQGESLLEAESGVSDASPKKKKSKRLAGRSRSLVDTNPDSRVSDTKRNTGRRAQLYLRRVPTQDDIYKILSETSDVMRPSTSIGQSKRLTRYEPLPAIGTKFEALDGNDNTVTDTPEPVSVTSCDDSNKKLVRERTYNVLEPKFVKGPTVDDLQQDLFDNFQEKKNEEREWPRNVDNHLEESSATVVFGPRLPREEEDIVEEDLIADDLSVEVQQWGSSTVSDSEVSSQSKKSVSVTRVNIIPMQKLYYRDSRQNGSPRLSDNVTSAAPDDLTNHCTNDKPKVHQTLWFD